MNNTNTNTTNFNEAIRKVENAIEELSQILENEIGDPLDENDPRVKLYRALGNVAYIIETNEEFCAE